MSKELNSGKTQEEPMAGQEGDNVNEQTHDREDQLASGYTGTLMTPGQQLNFASAAEKERFQQDQHRQWQEHQFQERAALASDKNRVNAHNRMGMFANFQPSQNNFG